MKMWNTLPEYPTPKYDHSGNIVIFSDFLDYDNGVVVTTQNFQNGTSEIKDWHPNDAWYAKDWASEIAYCEDIISVRYENQNTNEDLTFKIIDNELICLAFGKQVISNDLAFQCGYIESIIANSGTTSTCIGCGCDDFNACVNEYREPCSWIVVDYEKGVGVCSCCSDSLKDWEK